MQRTLIVVASLALGACRGDRPAPAKAPPADAAAASGRSGPAVRVLEPTRVPAPPRTPMPRHLRDELVTPGRGAKRVLRYDLAPTSRTLTATARITSRGFDGGFTEPITLAPVREGFEVTPIAGGGPVQVRGLVAEVERDGQPATAIAAADAYLAHWRSLLERRRADVGVDDRGRLGDVTLIAAPGAGSAETRDELVQRWLGLAVPLPEPAVGVGARWTVVTMLRAGGAMVTQTARYELVRLERDRWIIDVELSRLGKLQAIAVAGLPRGTHAELVALLRKVTGTVTVSPASPLPIAGELTAEVQSHARFTAPGGLARDQYSEDKATIVLSSTAPPAPPP